MALPKVIGANPTEETILKDGWRLVAQAVNIAKFHSNFGANQRVKMTYVKTGDPAPIPIDTPSWDIPNDFLEFIDSVTARDVYLYAIGEDAIVTIES